MSNKTCGAHAGSQVYPFDGPPYVSCGDQATHVEVDKDMRVYLCARHAEIWRGLFPTTVINAFPTSQAAS